MSSSREGIITLALNDNRSIALEALINYALEFANTTYGRPSNKAHKLETDVINTLEKLLNAGEGLLVHSIFGKYFPNLVYLDSDWAKENISLIFPLQKAEKRKFISTWGSYLFRGVFYENSYKLLRDQYKLGIELLTLSEDSEKGIDEIIHRVSYHLYYAFWKKMEPMFGEKSLIQDFITNAPSSDIAKFIVGLGSGLKEVRPEKTSQEWIDLKELWKQRFQFINNQEEPVKGRELSAFLSWVPYFPEDVRPFSKDILFASSRSELHEVIEVLEYFLSVEEYVPLAIELLNQVLENINEPWLLYSNDELFRNLLIKGMKLRDADKGKTIRVINRLGELGFWEYRQILIAN